MQSVQRFAWVFGVVGFLLGVAAASWYALYETVDTWEKALLIGSGLCLSTWLYLDREALADTTSSRQFRYGSGAFSLVVIALCLTVGVNMLANKKPKRWDFTQDQRFSISEKTKGVLAGLQTEVVITAFFVPWDPNEQAFRLLREGLVAETDKVKIDVVNPYADSARAEAMDVLTDRGVVILQVGERKERLERDFDQQAVTDAIIRLTSGEDHKICWMQGHGEPDPDDDAGRDAFGSAVIALENGNYTIAKRNPLKDGFDTCAAVAIVRPETDWYPPELEAVAAYVAGGGRLLVMLDPGAQGTDAPRLVADLARYGAKVGEDLVLDDNPMSQQLQMPPYVLMLGEPTGSFAMHPIVEKLHSFVIFEGARSVGSLPAEGREVTEIIQTMDTSWAETDLDPTTPKSPAEEGQRRVPVAIAATISDPASVGVRTKAAPAPAPAPADTDAGDTDAGVVVDLSAGSGLGAMDPASGVPADFAPKAGGRVVVFGDSDFAGGSNLAEGNDKDLFINAIAWLCEEEDQLGAQEDDASNNKITLDAVGGLLLGMVGMLFVPGAFAGLGVATMLRRRFL